MNQYFVIANYGDDSVALIQWLHENKIQNIYILSVDTGWQAYTWNDRLNKAFNWIDTLDFSYNHLKVDYSFIEIVKSRKTFPSVYNTWCSQFLKGFTLLNYMEMMDDNYENIVILPHRRSMSVRFSHLNEFVSNHDKYDNRSAWYPLYKHKKVDVDNLIHRSPFIFPLNHRSLECQPCIYHSLLDHKHISKHDVQKTVILEKKINNNMFDNCFDKMTVFHNNNYYDKFAESCSWDYACGL